MLVNCICRSSISSPFSLTFHPSFSEKQASNFDNLSSNSKACDWISIITSMSGLLEKCQKVCSSAGSVKNYSGFFPTFSGHPLTTEDEKAVLGEGRLV